MKSMIQVYIELMPVVTIKTIVNNFLNLTGYFINTN